MFRACSLRQVQPYKLPVQLGHRPGRVLQLGLEGGAWAPAMQVVASLSVAAYGFAVEMG